MQKALNVIRHWLEHQNLNAKRNMSLSVTGLTENIQQHFDKDLKKIKNSLKNLTIKFKYHCYPINNLDLKLTSISS